MKKAIFWFRQDLRVYDNTWFIDIISRYDEVLPIFILDEKIIWNFGWLSDKKFGFIREALENLDKKIFELSNNSLRVFYWDPEEIIPKLMTDLNIDTLWANKSYSLYWTKRDANLSEKLDNIWKNFVLYKDYLLVEPFEVEQKKVFTPFYKIWQKKIWDTKELEPTKFKQVNFDYNKKASDFIDIKKHPYFTMDFGIDRFQKHIRSDYNEFRNDLDKDWTSKLSPYLRFWIFSIRQIYNKAKNINSHFVQELAWREFWQHINYYFPETKTIEFQERKRHIKWSKDSYLFEKWCNWETWYPIVDAAMKQLLETNWMHWRARMIVASFLTKDLLIDWRMWESFFKRHLLDYDENVNFWNWQWSASVWADPKPLRIFNPSLQSEKFDPKWVFIKKYIPSLKDENIKDIHNPENGNLKYLRIIVKHSEAQKIARLVYKWELELKN